MWDLAVSGDYLYVPSGGQLRVIDISDPWAPVQVAAMGNQPFSIAI